MALRHAMGACHANAQSCNKRQRMVNRKGMDDGHDSLVDQHDN